MKKTIMDDDFIEDLNVDVTDKKKRNVDSLTVEDLNVEKEIMELKTKPRKFKVEDLNLDDRPASQKMEDWTVIEAEKAPEEKTQSAPKKTTEETLEEEKQESTEEEKKTSPQREVLSWCMTFLLAVAVAFVLKRFVIINATVPTGSMEHTIEPEDDLMGLRLAYLFSGPERGDIIIFRYPDDESKRFIKRVIGLPGETVKIINGKIYIDDEEEPLKEDYLKEEWVKGTGPFEYEIPEDSYLVLGDNRNDSLDARYWEHTYVTSDQIIGKAYVIYYPFSHMGSLYK